MCVAVVVLVEVDDSGGGGYGRFAPLSIAMCYLVVSLELGVGDDFIFSITKEVSSLSPSSYALLLLLLLLLSLS